MKKFLIIFLSVMILAGSVSAKNSDFSITRKKYRPLNQKILKQSWSLGLKSGHPGKRYSPEISNPVLVDGVIYVGTHGKYFYAVDAKTGKRIWSFKNDEPIAATAVVSGGRVFFTDLGGQAMALNAADGTLAWRQQFDAEMLGRPVVAGNTIVLVKGEQEILALSQDSGVVVWHRFVRTFIKNMTMQGHADIVVDGSRLLLGLADGGLYALNASTGDVLWNQNLSIPLATFKDIDSALVTDADSLFVGGYFGKLYRLDRQNGRILWSVAVPTGVSPLVIGGAVVVSDQGDGSLNGYDRTTGRKLWSNELNGSVLSAPVAYSDKIYVSSNDGEGFLLDPESGAQLQKIPLSSGSITSPLSDADWLYVLTNGAKLLAFQKKN